MAPVAPKHKSSNDALGVCSVSGVGHRDGGRATLADAIRSRQISCVEVMAAYLNHIENLNPNVNAIVALQDRGALLAQASDRDAQLSRAS